MTVPCEVPPPRPSRGSPISPSARPRRLRRGHCRAAQSTAAQAGEDLATSWGDMHSPDPLQGWHSRQPADLPLPWVGSWVRGTVLFRPSCSPPAPAWNNQPVSLCHQEEQESCVLRGENVKFPVGSQSGRWVALLPAGPARGPLTSSVPSPGWRLPGPKHRLLESGDL